MGPYSYVSTDGHGLQQSLLSVGMFDALSSSAADTAVVTAAAVSA